MKQQTCKYISEEGIACLSPFHSKMYHKPRKEIKRSPIKSKLDCLPLKEKPKKKKAPSRSQLVKKLDAVFSIYIRQRDDLIGCITCGEVKVWKEMQNCHFYSRGQLPTRWDETNCHSGCYRCNVLLKGNYINYTKYMIDRYGREYVDMLEIKSKSNIKITSVELKEMIAKYTILTKTIDITHTA